MPRFNYLLTLPDTVKVGALLNYDKGTYLKWREFSYQPTKAHIKELRAYVMSTPELKTIYDNLILKDKI